MQNSRLGSSERLESVTGSYGIVAWNGRNISIDLMIENLKYRNDQADEVIRYGAVRVPMEPDVCVKLFLLRRQPDPPGHRRGVTKHSRGAD